MRLVELAGHAGKLRALAGKHERPAGGLSSDARVVARQPRQGLDRLLARRAGDGGALPEGAPAGLKGVGDIGQGDIRDARRDRRRARSPRREAPRRCGPTAAARSCASRRPRRCARLRRFLEHDMRVGAADPEGADARPARTVAGRPRPRRRRDNRTGLPAQSMCGLGRRKLSERRDLAMLQRQRGLDQAGDARRGVEMADIGLDRADRAERPLGVGACRTPC